MIRNNLLGALAGLALALIATLTLTVTIEEHRLHVERTRVATLALHASNMIAEGDSTRETALTNRTVARLLGDTLRLVEKQVVQTVQHRDALDRALGRERMARYMMSVTMDSLRRVGRARPPADSERGARRARFDVHQVPYNVSVDVQIPAPPDTARFSLQIALDPIHVDARVGCSPPDDHGIRRASVAASTPSWASIHFDRLEQSPDLCASPALVHATGRHFLPRVTPVIGAGRVMTSGGRGFWGLFLGVGLTGQGGK